MKIEREPMNNYVQLEWEDEKKKKLVSATNQSIKLKIYGSKTSQITRKLKTSRNFSYMIISHLELLFLTVFALPKASRTGFDCIKSFSA